MTFARVGVSVFAVSLGFAAGDLQAQAPSTPEKPKFEVASVRENTSGDGKAGLGFQPGGRFNAVNIPLTELIRLAYGLQQSQLVGLPDWAENARFDVVAKAEGEPPRMAPGSAPGPFNFMLQDLLEDRFKLRVRLETREIPTYVLTLARNDGKLGPAIKPSTAECSDAMGRGRGRMAAPPAPGERPPCGMMMAPGHLRAGGVSMTQLTQVLSKFTQRVVIDRTGLTGNYEFDLTFTPDRMPQGAPPPGVQLPPIDPNGPSIFTAVQEQLGLKLDSQRAPSEVLVVEHVERPTPD